MSDELILDLNEFSFQKSQFYNQVAKDIDLQLFLYRRQCGYLENEFDQGLRELAEKCAKQSYQSGINMLDNVHTCEITKLCIFRYNGISTDGGDIFWDMKDYLPENDDEQEEQNTMETIFESGDNDRFEVGVFGTDETKIIAIAFKDDDLEYSVSSV